MYGCVMLVISDAKVEIDPADVPLLESKKTEVAEDSGAMNRPTVPWLRRMVWLFLRCTMPARIVFD